MPQKKRVIGLTGPSHFTPECQEAIEDLLDANFVLLYQNKEEHLKYWLDNVDGVILAGGIDIHPTVYSESIWNNHNLSKFDIKRDFRELAIIEYCLTNDKPMLGICRGHQLLGVRFGLQMLVDISNSDYCHQPGAKSGVTTNKAEPVHEVDFPDEEAKERFYDLYRMPAAPEERAKMFSILGHKKKSSLWVNSFHHQALLWSKSTDYKSLGVEVLGLARVDLSEKIKQIIEIMQGVKKKWLSVQWHPEFDFKENSASRVVLERFRTLMNH